jgi:hypothetical protein
MSLNVRYATNKFFTPTTECDSKEVTTFPTRTTFEFFSEKDEAGGKPLVIMDVQMNSVEFTPLNG